MTNQPPGRNTAGASVRMRRADSNPLGPLTSAALGSQAFTDGSRASYSDSLR